MRNSEFATNCEPLTENSDMKRSASAPFSANTVILSSLFCLLILMVGIAPADTRDGIYYEGEIVELSEKGDRAVINLGASQRVLAGDRFVVIRKGEADIDPATGSQAGPKQLLIGELKALEPNIAFTGVEITKGVKDVTLGDIIRRKTSPPTGITATPIGFRKIEIKWNIQAEPETKGYVVYRSESEHGNFQKLSDINGIENSNYVDTHTRRSPMADSFTYYYKVAAVNSFKTESDMSEMVSAYTADAPKPPANLSGQSNEIRSVPLTWDEHPNEEVAGYIVYRSNTPVGPFESIASLKGRKTISYTDYNEGSGSSPKLEDSTIYHYAISAYSPYEVEGDKSFSIAVRTSDPPTPPLGLEVIGWRAREVPIRWKAHEDKNVRGYFILRSKNETGPFDELVEIKGRNKNGYIDKGSSGYYSGLGKLEDLTTYYYRLQAYNWVDAKSEPSEIVAATTKAAPLPPEDVKAASLRPNSIPLSWRESPESDLKEYRIYRSDKEDGKYRKLGDSPAGKNYYLDDRLDNFETWFYKITAINKEGIESGFSLIGTATTKKLPDKITGLAWDWDGDKVTLKWNASQEMDIETYRIYTKGFFGWSKIAETKEVSFTVPGFKGGEKEVFSITSFDSDGLESKKSDSLTIDLR